MSSLKVVEVKGNDKGGRKATCRCILDRREVNTIYLHYSNVMVSFIML